jgi:hypothetical protein
MASEDEIATLRIDLLDTEPPIWRTLEVPTSMTLAALHQTVQAAMGWWDQHFWEMRIGAQHFAPDPGDDIWDGEPPRDAAAIRLRDVLKGRRTVIDYVYDMGDSWEHRLLLTDVRAGDPDGEYPRWTGGERACPPEDCGGLPGFYAVLDALADPTHPDHGEVTEWHKGYDPEAIDEEVARIALSRIARRRTGGKGMARKRRSGG